MAFGTGVCEICGKHRTKYDHTACSKKKQEMFKQQRRNKPIKRNGNYADEKKLDSFLKIVGE